MPEKLHLLSATQIAEAVNTKQITAVQVCQYFVERAEKLNPKINAFNIITKDLALEQAAAVDQKILNGEVLPLAGVPIGIKDNLCVKGTATTCSSKMLKNYIAPYESTVTEKLWVAGAMCLGKTNLDEFAMGSSTEHSAFGPTNNPWNLKMVPGGSSGGSAAAVAARLVPLALGSDTGGSIRQPAALCGITGMKPTYGLVSRYGLIAFASSLDQIGPFASNIEDTNLLFSVIAGHDPKDSTSLKIELKGDLSSDVDLSKLKIGLIKELKLSEANTEPSVVKGFDEAINKLRAAGAQIEEISLPLITEHALDVYYIIAPAEASSNLARYDGVRYGHRSKEASNLLEMYQKTRAEGFGSEVIRRIIIGTYALSSGYYDAYYKKAQQVRRLVKEEFEKAFKQFDLLISPTSPLTAFPMGDKMEDPLAMYLCDIATIPANLAGLPALSFNCGFDKGNLPIGMQVISPALHDYQLLSAASALEKTCGLQEIPELAK
jgi:aspartyl-tRNA(Asn)/glutamyl-tRNA(Gln) amidotransferase subunit A